MAAQPIYHRIDVESETITWAPDDLVGVSWLTTLLALSGLLYAAQSFLGRKRSSGWGRSDGGGSGGGYDGGALGAGFSLCWWWVKAVSSTYTAV